MRESIGNGAREGWNVFRLAARNEVAVGDDLLIDPLGSGVDEVGVDRGPGGDGARKAA